MSVFDWIPTNSNEKPPKAGQIYAVCGRESGSNRPFWTRGLWLPDYYHQASAEELASEGTENFSYSQFHDAWFWPEGWYEVSDYDSGAYPIATDPQFYAEADLPVALMMAGPLAVKQS
jgi:hypothetical protein